MTAPVLYDRWLPLGATGVGLPLYCLPHAGGSASAFRSWIGRVEGADVRPVQPPGREMRIKEPPFRAIEPLVAEITGLLPAGPEPYALYGHSLGALVAFEVAREVRRRGGQQPVHLVVSGGSAPDHDRSHSLVPPFRELTDAQGVALLRRLGGTPEWVLADPSAMGMLLPIFRGDFAVRDSHRYLPEAPLDVPITVIAASDDPQAPLGSTDGWRRQTTGPYRRHVITGGHFAALQQAALTQRYLGDALRAHR